MVSMPLSGLEPEEADKIHAKAVRDLELMGFTPVSTYTPDERADLTGAAPGWNSNRALFLLAKALQVMCTCDAVYFLDGWEGSRGCRIEHEAALSYGKEIIYQD